MNEKTLIMLKQLIFFCFGCGGGWVKQAANDFCVHTINITVKKNSTSVNTYKLKCETNSSVHNYIQTKQQEHCC